MLKGRIITHYECDNQYQSSLEATYVTEKLKQTVNLAGVVNVRV